LQTVAAPIPRQTQAERRSRSEEALLDAAAKLIADQGVERASMASIGADAGVSRGLPNHHFGSKDVMVARLAARAQDRIATELRDEARRRYGSSVNELSSLEVIGHMIDGYLDLFTDPSPDFRALLVMWGSTFARNAAVDGMIEAERRSYDGLAGVITDGQADGSIRTDIDPTAAAVLLLGTIRGVAALLLTDSAIVDMKSVRATCRSLIDTGLANVATSHP
jgi:AcrR family transcriptional regulator